MGSQVRVLYRAPPENLEAIWLQGFSFANPHSSRPLPRSLILPAADTSGGDPKGSPPVFYGFPIIYRYSAGEWLAPLATCLSAASQDYGIMVGAVIVGSIFEGILGLTAKYWRRIISPIVSSRVLGGCTVIMFGSIMMSGVRMMHDAGMNQRNTLIAATSICLGVGVTQVDGFFDQLPAFVGEIFAGNMVAGVFVVALILDICLPKDPKHYDSV
jgi:xanthine/uracil permease